MTLSTPSSTQTGSRDAGGFAIVEPSESAWAAFTLNHPHGHLLQSAGWGTLKRSTGWHNRRVLVVSPTGALAGAQLLTRRLLGVSIAYVPRGPLFAASDQVNRLLILTLERLARRSRAICLRFEPNVLETDGAARELHELLLRHTYRPTPPIMPQSTIHLDLAASPEHLFAGFSKGHRAAIRRAEREGVTIRRGEQAADLDAFYGLMRETSARANFGIYSHSYYHLAWHTFASDAHAQLFIAERGQTVVAAALIFAWAGVASYLYGGSTVAGLACGANHAIQWQAIQWAREQGCQLYDFWFVPDHFGTAAAGVDGPTKAGDYAPPHPLDGVFRFKKSFGGSVVRYMPAYDRVYIPPLYTLLRRRWQP